MSIAMIESERLMDILGVHQASTSQHPLLLRSENSFAFIVIRLLMKLFRTASPAVVKCYQLAFLLYTHNLTFVGYCNLSTSSLHLRTLRTCLCYLFTLTARRKLDKLLPSLTMSQRSQCYTWQSDVFTCFELRGICKCLLTILYVYSCVCSLLEK